MFRMNKQLSYFIREGYFPFETIKMSVRQETLVPRTKSIDPLPAHARWLVQLWQRQTISHNTPVSV